jgi:hypothetical protein
MSEASNAWFGFAEDAIRLGFAAQSVIALRVAKVALGGTAAGEEAQRMVVEKAQAAIEVQALMTQSLIAGEAHLAPARVLGLYRRRVEANRRRLCRGE